MRRRSASRLVRVLRGDVLPAVPDRRQGPRRPPHEPTGEVASNRAEGEGSKARASSRWTPEPGPERPATKSQERKKPDRGGGRLVDQPPPGLGGECIDGRGHCLRRRTVELAAVSQPLPAWDSSRARARASSISARCPLHMYGLMLAIGVLVAVRVAEVRWVRRGHKAKEFSDLVVWIVIWGVIGARLYHVITDYQLFEDDPLQGVQDLGRRARDLGRGHRRRDRGDRPRAGAVTSISATCSTPSRPGSCSRRRSVGGATGSTRSCSVGRPRCPGGSRSTSRSGPPSTCSTRRSTRRSSTSRSTASRWGSRSSGSITTSG